MVPLRFATRNRWLTLLWAGGICLTAYHVAGPSEDHDEAAAARTVAIPASAAPDGGDLGAAVEALNQKH